MTGILDYAIPMYFVSRGLGEDESKTLIDLIKQKSILLKPLLLGAQIYSTNEGTNTNDLGVAGSLEGILVAMTKGVFLNLKSTILELWDCLVAKEAEEEAEIATNPIVIHNTVSFTHSVTVVVSHDPEDFEFPLLATHFQVQITAGSKALEPSTIVEINPEDRSSDTLTAVVENVPATGSNATVSVIFLPDNGYPLARSAAVDANGNPVLDENGNRVPGDITFLNKLPASGDLVVDVPIVENPVPIDAETQYTHDHKLE